MNMGKDALKRAGELMRLPMGPSRVKRIGHGVMAAPDVRATVQWFRDTLGFICSDDVYAGSKDNIIGSFNRCDRGSSYVDHHVFFCIRNDRAGLNHLSYEVQDIDDVFMGHEHLQRSSASTSTCGASGGISWEARSTTTGRTRGAACTSTGPTPTG